MITSLADLHRSLGRMSQVTFQHHVGDSHHDFADWVRHALGDASLANALASQKNPAVLRSIITQSISPNPKKQEKQQKLIFPGKIEPKRPKSWWDKWRQNKKIESLAEWESSLSLREQKLEKNASEMLSRAYLLVKREKELEKLSRKMGTKASKPKH